MNHERYQQIGAELVENQRKALETQMEVFRAALLEFKRDHSDEIGQSPDITASFSEICIAFGIDPLVVTLDTNPAERNNQLALKVVEFCTNSRFLNGGIVSVNDLLISINKDTWLSEDLHLDFNELDIKGAIDHLNVLGSELKLVKIGKRQYIKCTPQELNIDQQQIIETAEMLGFVSVPMLRDNFHWKTVRCKSAIDELVMNGILWLDAGERELKYWTTSWINKDL